MSLSTWSWNKRATLTISGKCSIPKHRDPVKSVSSGRRTAPPVQYRHSARCQLIQFVSPGFEKTLLWCSVTRATIPTTKQITTYPASKTSSAILLTMRTTKKMSISGTGSILLIVTGLLTILTVQVWHSVSASQFSIPETGPGVH